MDSYISAPSLSFSTPDLAEDTTEQSVQDHLRKVRCHSAPNPMGSGHPRGEPESKKRRVSLSDAVQHLTLAEPPASLCEPVPEPMEVTVAAQPSRPAYAALDRPALKAALYNLSTNNMSRADFIVLLNRYGYCPALYSFPLDTLQPSDWLAIRERSCAQILLCNGSFLAQLPPQAITCTTVSYTHLTLPTNREV